MQNTQQTEDTQENLDVFGISREIMLDCNKIKIICGIAGSAKSSSIDTFFNRIGESYGRYTSTNKLKRDAKERYGCYCDTIAGGLFSTIDGRFFADEKDVDFKNIVIDEVLQTDPKIFEWVRNNRGSYNIIITTDENQMLNSENGEFMLREFKRLYNESYSIYVELTKTYRARDEKTERYFNICYQSVSEKDNRFKLDSKWFRQINFQELRYNHTDVFICHSNSIELELYREWDIYNDYSADLISKGSIARKEEIDPFKYPIIPQAQTPRANIPYLQPVNVGSVTRYQGSEVAQNQTLYFLVGRGDFVNNREWYTAVTRLWTINNLVIVWCDIKKIKPLKIYNDKPVKETGWYSLTDDILLSDGSKLSDVIKDRDSKDVFLSDVDMQKILEKIPSDSNIYYNRNAVLFGDKVIKRSYTEENDSPPRNAPTMLGFLQKEPDFTYDYLPDFYRAFETVQKQRYNGAKVTEDILVPPSIIAQERDALTPFPSVSEYENIRSRNSYRYALDFHSSYPCILYNEKLPTGSFFYPRVPECKDDKFHTSICTGMVDWYISYCDIFPEGCICTGELVRFIQSHTLDYSEFHYIGTSSCKKGSRMGAKLHEMAYRTVESKSLIKHVHYGLADRPYVERIEFDDSGNNKSYALNKTQNHQLLMLAIRSYQCLNILKLAHFIYGDFHHGVVNADCLYFDSQSRVQRLGKQLAPLVPGYDFRICNNKEGKNRILFKTYQDIPTATELAKEKRRKKLDN